MTDNEVNKAEPLPPGSYVATLEGTGAESARIVIVGGKFDGVVVNSNPLPSGLGMRGIISHRDIAFGNIPRIDNSRGNPKLRVYQQLAIAELLEAYRKAGGELSTKDLIVVDSCGAYPADKCWFDDCQPTKPKKNKGPVKSKDWLGRGGDRYDKLQRN